MAKTEIVFGELGGTLAPTLVHTAPYKASDTYPIDSSKKYIAVGVLKNAVTSTESSVAYIDKGVITLLKTCSNVSLTLTGTTLSVVSNSAGGYGVEWVVIQLD